MTRFNIASRARKWRPNLRRASASRRTLLYGKARVGFRRVGANLLTGDYREEDEGDERELVEHDWAAVDVFVRGSIHA